MSGSNYGRRMQLDIAFQPGMIPHNPATDSTLPIPVIPPAVGVVHAHSRSGHIISLADFADKVWKDYEDAEGEVRETQVRFMRKNLPVDETIVQGSWHFGLELALLSGPKKHSKERERSLEGILYLARHLKIDKELLTPSPNHQWSLPSEVSFRTRWSLKWDKYLTLRWAGVRLLETFRLINDLTSRGSHNIDTEKVFIQFLRLVIIDIDEETGTKLDRTDWSVEVWQKIRDLNSEEQQNSVLDPFSQAIHSVNTNSVAELELWAKSTERWAREEMRKRGTRIDEKKLPLGEISFRIMRICSQFHHTIIKLWKNVGDPRGHTLPRWKLAARPHHLENLSQSIVMVDDIGLQDGEVSLYPSKNHQPQERGLERVKNLFKKKGSGSSSQDQAPN